MWQISTDKTKGASCAIVASMLRNQTTAMPLNKGVSKYAMRVRHNHRRALHFPFLERISFAKHNRHQPIDSPVPLAGER